MNDTQSDEMAEGVAPSGVLSPPHGVDPNWAEKIVASREAREMGAKLHELRRRDPRPITATASLTFGAAE